MGYLFGMIMGKVTSNSHEIVAVVMLLVAVTV